MIFTLTLSVRGSIYGFPEACLILSQGRRKEARSKSCEVIHVFVVGLAAILDCDILRRKCTAGCGVYRGCARNPQKEKSDKNMLLRSISYSCTPVPLGFSKK